jgi:hypothetical protein
MTLAAAINAESNPSNAIDLEFNEPAEIAVSTTSKAIEIITAVSTGASDAEIPEAFVTIKGQPKAITPTKDPKNSNAGVMARLTLASKLDGINCFFDS